MQGEKALRSFLAPPGLCNAAHHLQVPSVPSQVFAIGAATVMAQRPSLDADALGNSGIVNLSRVSKFRGSPDGSRISDGGPASGQTAAASAADGGRSGAAASSPAAESAQPGRIEVEVAAEHVAAAAAAAAAASAAAAESHPEREANPDDAAHAARDAAAAVEPPEWFIRCCLAAVAAAIFGCNYS